VIDQESLIARVAAANPIPNHAAADGHELEEAERVLRRVLGASELEQSVGRVDRAPLQSADRGRHRRRLLGLLLPALSVAVTVGVVVAAVTLLHAGRHDGPQHAATGGHGRTANATPVPSAPAGGMSGFVTVWGAGFGSASDGVISLEQCLRCQPNGNETSRSTFTDWLLTTSDGGRSWSRTKTGYYVQRPLLAGQDGWAGGLQMLSRKQAGALAEWQPGVGAARYFVTHDGGRSWSVAPSAAPNEGGSVTSLVGNEVWAVGLGLHVAILRAPAAGRALTATASQPIQGDDTNIGVEGAGAGSAYVANANAPRQTFATHDDGRTWQQLTTPPCTGKYAFARLDAAFGQTVWLTCSEGVGRTPRLIRSLDGGHSWQQTPIEWGAGGPQQLTAATANVAWALNADGDLLRTTNAGASWQLVWSATDAQVSPLSHPITKPTPSPLPILSVQSPDSASIVTLLNRGTSRRAAKLTNLVVYRTTNGGQSWQTYPVSP
jgi:photosystem II stability/assembly factor-like uncharacterized protein